MKITFSQLDPLPLDSELAPDDFPCPVGVYFNNKVAKYNRGGLADNLLTAIDAGTIDPKDLAIIRMELNKIQSGRTVSDSLPGVDVFYDEYRDPRFDTLRTICLKYCAEGEDAPNMELQKRRKPRTDLKPGMKVRGIDGSVGTITDIDGILVKITFPSGPAVSLDYVVELVA